MDSLAGYDVSFKLTGNTEPSGDIHVKFEITSESDEVRHVDVRLYANAKYYTGVAGEEIDAFKKEVILQPKHGTPYLHDDVMVWKYYWPFVRGIHRWLMDSHCRNQCWLIFSKVQSHSSEDTSAIN